MFRQFRRPLASLVLGLFFVGAVGAGVSPSMTKWTHPNKTAEEQKEDADDCAVRAVARDHARKARGGSLLDELPSDQYDECMRDKGYEVVSP